MLRNRQLTIPQSVMGKFKKRHSGMTQTREPPIFDSFWNLRQSTRQVSKLTVETRNHLKKRGWIWKAIWVEEFKNNKHMKNKIFFISVIISLVSTFSVLNASEKNLSTDHYIIQSIVSFLVAFLISFFGLRYYEKK